MLAAHIQIDIGDAFEDQGEIAVRLVVSFAGTFHQCLKGFSSDPASVSIRQKEQKLWVSSTAFADLHSTKPQVQIYIRASPDLYNERIHTEYAPAPRPSQFEFSHLIRTSTSESDALKPCRSEAPPNCKA